MSTAGPPRHPKIISQSTGHCRVYHQQQQRWTLWASYLVTNMNARAASRNLQNGCSSCLQSRSLYERRHRCIQRLPFIVLSVFFGVISSRNRWWPGQLLEWPFDPFSQALLSLWDVSFPGLFWLVWFVLLHFLRSTPELSTQPDFLF